MSGERSFGQDVAFLNQNVETIVLRSEAGEARVAVVPGYQGRVMTSTANGDDGTSYGWINYEHIQSGEIAQHMNAYGGEERFWLGPEGGQFSIFFKPGTEFVFADWTTPAVIDTEAYDVVAKDDQKVSFRKETTLQNYSRSSFHLQIDRSIEVLSSSATRESLGIDPGQLDFVGYRTTNSVKNLGGDAWTKDSGLLSIWLLGMYKPGPQTTVVIPYEKGPEAELGPVVNDAYFGVVPKDRLKVDDGFIFFSGDGEYRSKIGLSPQRATDVCGSYDAERGVLTIVKYSKPGPDCRDYVNSMWEIQEEPFAGDTVNAYNDGPPEPGAEPMGPFYELETSSPAFALKPGATGTHVQETYHFEGDREALDRIATEVLGLSLSEITSALE